jgi:tetratricopeptide (TPR) repeat protein
MFGWFESQSPLTADHRRWIDERFTWLRQQFGEARLRGVVVTPTDAFFPDRYAPTPEGAAPLLDRVCGYMGVERTRIDLQFYTSPSADDIAAAFNPMLQRGYALGAFHEDGGQIVIWLEKTRLSEPHSVVSTFAHELGHVLLLADGRCDRSTPDHEPLTDLLTVFFGLGVFTANNAIREVNWRTGNYSGWSIGRQGYLTIAEYAYALALYAYTRGEHRPPWVKFLRPDVRGLFKTESKRIAAGGACSSGEATSCTATSVENPIAFQRPPANAEEEAENANPESDLDDQTLGEENSSTEESEAPEDQSADKYFELGSAYAAEREWEQAVGAYSQAIRLNPRDSEALLNRAEAHLQLGDFSEAVDDCSRSLAYDSNQLAAWCSRAHSYIWLRRYEEALNDLSEALRIENRDAQVHYFRGLAHFGLGKNREAIADLTKAWRYAPTWAKIYLARSRAYQAVGKTKNAEADLAEAIRRAPELAEKAERETCLAGRPLVEA